MLVDRRGIPPAAYYGPAARPAISVSRIEPRSAAALAGLAFRIEVIGSGATQIAS
jgi:hypothetical protein